jgi:hypothetical protein
MDAICVIGVWRSFHEFIVISKVSDCKINKLMVPAKTLPTIFKQCGNVLTGYGVVINETSSPYTS